MKQLFLYLLILSCLEISAQDKQSKNISPLPPPPPTMPDELPQFPGGENALKNFISSNLKYPDIAKEKRNLGICNVKFTVDVDGKIKNIIITKSVEYCFECDIEAKRLVSTMPNWKPGTKNGNPIDVIMTMPFDFSTSPKPTNYRISETDEIFTVVEEMPIFPGGQQGLYKFIQKNLEFPESAMKNNTYGKCFVNFIVRKDGKITDITVLKGVPNCPDCDEEAKKIFTKMPKWNPGMQNGKAVNVYFNQPINFQPR